MRWSGRQCGKCSLCCKTMSVPELDKLADTWCSHAKPGCGGCAIYPTRPSACRDFECMWLHDGSVFGEEWFPARCRMVLTPLAKPGSDKAEGIQVNVDSAFPTAWRKEPYYAQLLAIAQGMYVTLRIGRRQMGLRADGTEYEIGTW
jgi:hypothetical protein